MRKIRLKINTEWRAINKTAEFRGKGKTRTYLENKGSVQKCKKGIFWEEIALCIWFLKKKVGFVAIFSERQCLKNGRTFCLDHCLKELNDKWRRNSREKEWNILMNKKEKKNKQNWWRIIKRKKILHGMARAILPVNLWSMVNHRFFFFL